MRAVLAGLLVFLLASPGRAEVYREDPLDRDGWSPHGLRREPPDVHERLDPRLTRARIDEQLARVDAELRACVPEGHRPIRLRVRITRDDDVVVRTGLPRREHDLHLCLETAVLRAVVPLLSLRHAGAVGTVRRLTAEAP